MAKKFGLARDPLTSGPSFLQRESVGIPYREVPVSAIDRDNNQPRVEFDKNALKELSESIQTYGVLSPILIRPGKVPGRYQLVAGERRLRASKEAGLSNIPAIIDVKEDEGGARILAIQLVENMQRSNLTALEKAHAIGALRDAYELSIREVAARLGISKSSVQRSLDVLDLPDDLINALRQGVSESKVLMLSKVEDPAVRAELLKEADSISRKDLEISLKAKKNTSKPKKSKSLSAEDARLVDEMQRALGLKVSMKRNSQGSESGRLTLDFYTDTDLQLIFRSLMAKS